MAEWSVKLDLGEAMPLLSGLLAGLNDRTKLHELFVIQTQAWVFRNRAKTPPLSPLTRATRRKGSAEPLSDTGYLIQSVTGRSPTTGISTAEGTLNTAKAEAGVVGTRVAYGLIHQTGGTIHATRAKNLAIPMTRKAREAGSPRNFDPPLVFIPSKKSGVTGLLVERGRGKPFVLHYVLKHEIVRNGKTIRSRGKMFAIPMSPSAKRAGPPGKYSGKLTFIRSGKDPENTAYLVELRPRTKTKAHYLLKPSVYIPARPFLPTVEQITPVLARVAEWYLEQLASGQRPGKIPGAL